MVDLVTHQLDSARRKPVLFTSAHSFYEPGKPIRGGVPLAFPWFAIDQKADRINGQPGPTHGFARIQDWTVAFAAVAGEDVHMTFTLGPTAMSRSMGLAGRAMRSDTAKKLRQYSADRLGGLAGGIAIRTRHAVADSGGNQFWKGR